MKNLSSLAIESDECRSLLNKSLISPFLNSIVRKPMGIIFDTAPWRDQACFFWKFVLREALHSAQLGMFTDKSVASFLERIKADKIREGWLQCRKDYGVYLQGDGQVFVFYPSSFPWNKKDMYNVEGQGMHNALPEEKFERATIFLTSAFQLLSSIKLERLDHGPLELKSLLRK